MFMKFSLVVFLGGRGPSGPAMSIHYQQAARRSSKLCLWPGRSFFGSAQALADDRHDLHQFLARSISGCVRAVSAWSEQ
jgi:hypothetical protein